MSACSLMKITVKWMKTWLLFMDQNNSYNFPRKLVQTGLELNGKKASCAFAD
jgi:hypothetical protein